MRGRVTDKEILEYNMKMDGMGVWVSAIVSSILCICGVALLIYNPPVWGLTLGLPYSLGGFLLAILSFDRANRPKGDSKMDREDLEDEKEFLSEHKLKV